MRLVLGVGLNDLGWSHGNASKSSPEHQVIYRVWRAMLQQCYDKHFLEQNPSYKKAALSVCEEWKVLSNFAADIEKIPGYDAWLVSALDNLNCGRNNISLTVKGHVYCLGKTEFMRKSHHERKNDR